MNVIKGIIFHATVLMVVTLMVVEFSNFANFMCLSIVALSMVFVNYRMYKYFGHDNFMKYTGLYLVKDLEE